MTDSNDINLEIANIELQDILNNPNVIIAKLDQSQVLLLKDYIFDTLSDKDGGPTIQQLQISSLDYNEEYSKGKFRLKFEIERQFCCSDVQSCQNDYIDFTFNVSNQTMAMQATYFNWEVN